MIYTFQQLSELVGSRKYPPYLLIVSCSSDAEKALLYKNLYKYFTDVHILLYTTAEAETYTKTATEEAQKLWVMRIIGQIFTAKDQATAAGVVMGGGFLILTDDDVTNQTDLGEVFTRLFREMLDIQVYKCTHELPGDENIPKEWRNKVRKFWGDLVGDGYMTIDFTQKQIGN